MTAAEIVVQFLWVLLAMFIAARVLARVVEKAGLPGIIGEIAAGVIVGPSLLSIVQPADAGYGVALEAVAQVGIVILLFSVGLQTRFSDLKKVGRMATETATLGVLVPLGAGTALLLALSYDWRPALFVGAAMVATSVGITARVLSDLNQAQTKAARVILAAAVIDDVLGMIVLAVVGAVAGGGAGGFLAIAVMVAEALLFVGLTLAFLPRLVGRLAQDRLAGTTASGPLGHLSGSVSTRDAAFVLGIALCLTLAAASSLVGLAPIIGAFIAGVAFADVEPRFKIYEHLHSVRSLLVPFFFVLMGAKVSLGAFGQNPSLLLLALALTGVAVATKYFPCRFGARALGPDAARAVGFGMIPRGEVGLIIAAIALDRAIIDPALYSVVVFMALGTSIAAPPLLRRAMGVGTHEKVDRRAEIAAPHEWKPPE